MCQRNGSSKKAIGRITHLGKLVLCKVMSPSLRIIGIVLGLPHGRAGDFLGEFRVGFELVVQWGMLARRFDAAIGDGGGGNLLLVAFVGRQRRELAVDRVGDSHVVRGKRGCQTRSHGNRPGN